MLLVGSIIIARLLTPAEMGVFALAMAASYLFSSLKDFGINAYIIREKSLTDLKIRTAFGIWIIISFLIGLSLFSVRNAIAALYDTPGMVDVIIILSVSFLVTPLGQPANALLQREMHFDVLHHISLVSTVVNIGTCVSLAFLGYSYLSLAWGLLASTVVRSFLLLASRPDLIGMSPSLRHWRDALQIGGLLAGVSIIRTLNTEGVKFILGGLIDLSATAQYERANQIPSLIRNSLVVPVGQVLLPAFSKNIREGVSVEPTIVSLISTTTVIIWPAFLTLGFLSVPIVVFLFGENWRIAGNILPYILLANAILSALPDPTLILVPHGKVRKLFWLILFGTAINLLAVTMGCIHSIEMFAYLQPVQAAMFCAATFLSLRQYLHTVFTAIFESYLKAIGISVFTAAPAITAHIVYGADVPMVTLFLVAVLAPVLWFTAIFLFKHFLFQELSTLLKMGYLMLFHKSE